MGEPWFGVKTYGIGIGPKSPAGWMAVAVYVAAIIAVARVTAHFAAPEWARRAALAGLTLGFFVLTIVKSDRRPWRWRWGRD